MQIPIGDELVNLPQWATEQTMLSLASILEANDQSRQILLKTLQVTAKDIQGLEAATEALKEVEETEDKKENKSVVQTLRQWTKGTVNFIKGLEDTSKPLSSMTNMAKSFKNSVEDVASSDLMKNQLGKFSEKFQEGIAKFASGADLGADVALAYAGFLAAKTEQFAEAQASMIDSGAIYFESADRFEELRQLSYSSGVAYSTLAQTVSKFGKGIQSMGDGVSGGTIVFARTFNRLNKANDAFGDFGLTNTEMMEGFAEYVDAQRLGGNMDRLLANEGEGLIVGYQELMKENSMLATATAFSRKQLVAADIEALSDIDFRGRQVELRNKVGDRQAEAAEEIFKALTLSASTNPDQGGLGAKFGNRLRSGFIEAMGNFATSNGSSFNMLLNDPDFLGVLRNFEGGDELLDTITNDMISGIVRDKDEYLALIGQLEAPSEGILEGNTGILGLYAEFAPIVSAMGISLEKLANMSEEEKEALYNNSQRNLESAGGLTVAVNAAASALLKAQDLLIPNMATVSRTLRDIAENFTEEPTNSETQNRLDANNNRFTPVDPAPMDVADTDAFNAWMDRYGQTHDFRTGQPFADPNGNAFTANRFLGGYLGSDALSMVGEMGPEMLITDMPTYVKTIDQIGRNLGQAINTHTSDIGVTKTEYRGGYYEVSDDTGINLFDKAGELLYNELSIGGLTRRTYGSGDVAEHMVVEINGADVSKHFINGKLIGNDIEYGDYAAYATADGAVGIQHIISDALAIKQGLNTDGSRYEQSEVSKYDPETDEIKTTVIPENILPEDPTKITSNILPEVEEAKPSETTPNITKPNRVQATDPNETTTDITPNVQEPKLDVLPDIETEQQDARLNETPLDITPVQEAEPVEQPTEVTAQMQEPRIAEVISEPPVEQVETRSITQPKTEIPKVDTETPDRSNKALSPNDLTKMFSENEEGNNEDADGLELAYMTAFRDALKSMVTGERKRRIRSNAGFE